MTKLTINQHAALTVIRSEPGATETHIAHQTGLRPASVSRAIAALFAKGLIIRPGTEMGYYTLRD